MAADYDIRAHGDSALLLTFGSSIDPATNQRVHAAARAVRAAAHRGGPWSTPIPSYATLLVAYDALKVDFLDARFALAAVLDQVGTSVAADPREHVHEIPVRYGGEDGPDLSAVAERTGLTPAQVVELHSSVEYRAYMLGFSPGFAYLGELPAELEVPRRDTPRPRVPAGSVAIAGRQTAVYPLSTPGGWHIIGRTELAIWDATRDPAALIRAGQSVRFVPRA